MRDPVILIGAARSGTKVLRDLLAASGGVRSAADAKKMICHDCA